MNVLRLMKILKEKCPGFRDPREEAARGRTFTPFLRLPQELQDKIWKIVLQNERIVRRTIEAAISRDSIFRIEFNALKALPDQGRIDLNAEAIRNHIEKCVRCPRYSPTLKLNQFPYVSALLWVSHDSYNIAKANWMFKPEYMSPDTQFINYNQDLFHFHHVEMISKGFSVDSVVWNNFPGNYHIAVIKKDCSKIKHLLFTFPRLDTMIYQFLRKLVKRRLKHFTSLETVTIGVYKESRHPLQRLLSFRRQQRCEITTFANAFKPRWKSMLAQKNREVDLRFCRLKNEEQYMHPGKMDTLMNPKKLPRVVIEY